MTLGTDCGLVEDDSAVLFFLETQFPPSFPVYGAYV